jgi:nitrate/TMAO reductase-like tetraheme cytochrome c subunit
MKMRLKSLTLAGYILLLIPHIAYSADFNIEPPPQSMDKFYSDRGKTSEWIEQMRQISKSFGATLISRDKKNWGEALKHAQDFGASYQKASKMVPEWKGLFDLEASKHLVVSIQSQDTEKIKSLSEKVGKTCSQCHRKHNISVWTRYHWPSTKTIKVLDPIDEQEVDYDRFMHRLSFSFKNIEIFFEQEKYNESWKAIDNFSNRLRGLRSVCSKCHVTEYAKKSTTVKDYFVGEDIMATLQEIKKSFASGTPDTKLFQKKMAYIYMESCKMCHLIHQPAAIIQRAWANTP